MRLTGAQGVLCGLRVGQASNHATGTKRAGRTLAPKPPPAPAPNPCSYELRPNQEIIGLGLANFAGSAFNAYSTAGSFSRSTVNSQSGGRCMVCWGGRVGGGQVGCEALVVGRTFNACSTGGVAPSARAAADSQPGGRGVLGVACGGGAVGLTRGMPGGTNYVGWSCCCLATLEGPLQHTLICAGCKTPLAGFATSLVVGFVLLFLTPVFERLPMCMIGAIVISAVSGLLEYEQALHLFKVRQLERRAGQLWVPKGGKLPAATHAPSMRCGQLTSHFSQHPCHGVWSTLAPPASHRCASRTSSCG